MLFSALVDNVRFVFCTFSPGTQCSHFISRCVVFNSTRDNSDNMRLYWTRHSFLFRREKGGEKPVWGKLSLSIFWKLLVLVFISHFGIIAVALGRSLVDYALQIPCTSLCFVSGFKKLMCLDLRFKRSCLKNSTSVVPWPSIWLIRFILFNLFSRKQITWASLAVSLTLAEGRRVFAAGRSTSLLTADRTHRHPCCINLWSAIAWGWEHWFPSRGLVFQGVERQVRIIYRPHQNAAPMLQDTACCFLFMFH